ncbi:MAG TPA: hydroxysqualene dehydroxylase HpnE [Rhizobiaceae bacterium]|nr:hydroxysqualene dehydroxylase HpnE [Rhizobiaceae bacterium]
MTPRMYHVVGAGLAGLAAATRLAEAGSAVALYEAAPQAGGRCRSYHDPVLGRAIDNGNHLILSGNRSTLAFLKRIGAENRVSGPSSAEFFFVDHASGERWKLRIGDGPIPWWIFRADRRVPGTKALDYLALLRLLRPSPDATIGDALSCSGMLYDRLLGPVLLAIMNNEPSVSTAALASAAIRETLARGGNYCRPLIAHDGLGAAFVEPALAYLRARGAEIFLGRSLRKLSLSDRRVSALDFGGTREEIGANDVIVLAVPAQAAGRLAPNLDPPSQFRAIANLHFLVEGDVPLPPITGVIHATTQWIFAFPGRLSVTISNADALMDIPRKRLAESVWREVAAIARLPESLPRWQIVSERRATFATVPEQEHLRAKAETGWRNLFLAGDWTATGLPPTIEGAIRSGEKAANLALGTNLALGKGGG